MARFKARAPPFPSSLFLLCLTLYSVYGATQQQQPIKTVVVLVLENRSFDHMIGWMKNSINPQINGVTGKECNPISTKAQDPKSICFEDDAEFVDPDPGHSFEDVAQQGAIPQMIENTKDEFFSKIVEVLKEAADVCYSKIKEIPCITCPSKPQGSMFVMVKLNLSVLEGVKDDLDFCVKLAKEESVVVVPGFVVGLKDWLRITFGMDPSSLAEGLERIKAFSLRHAKKQ